MGEGRFRGGRPGVRCGGELRGGAGGGQGLHGRLHAPAGGGQPGVVRGLGVGGDRDQPAYVPGAVVEQREHLPGPGLTGAQRAQRVHEGRERHPYPAQEQLQFGGVRGGVGVRVAREAVQCGRGAGAYAVQGALDPGVVGRVGGDREDDHDGKGGAECADRGLLEAQEQQSGVQDAEEPVEQTCHDGDEEHHPGVRGRGRVEDPEDAYGDQCGGGRRRAVQGYGDQQPGGDADDGAEDAAEAPYEGLAPGGGVHEDPPGGADGPVPAVVGERLADAEREGAGGGGLEGLPGGRPREPRSGQAGRGRGGGVRRSMGHSRKRTAPEATSARPTAAKSSGSCPGRACRNWVTKNIMKPKIPRACPRGPKRRAYTPANTTARKAASRASGTPCRAVARARTGNPATGSRAVVRRWARTSASRTVKRARRAASPR